ncbi:hypothetical protein TMPK1_17980 [Rhodospirillales bacterium TMPK1]|uniref:HTH LytTR-type domain-containing protein n=2 Tax=Roseiterribacter gracilis TaxID=2812848 RepID=A0A8S8XCH8_9PROT|nr:hypothetical protein TMPK1_17980 [Rhodospirillales bacterium TMPK1]
MSGGNIWRNQALRAAIWIAVILVPTTVNSFSRLTEASWRGETVPTWLPFTLEYSSAIGMWVVIALYLRARRWVVPAAIGWKRSIAAHVLIAPLFCLGHFLVMNGLRTAIWSAFLGRAYGLNWVAELPYEARKDFPSFATFVLLAAILERLATDPAPAPVVARAKMATIEVRTSSRTLFLRPDEIRSASAAGNYIELATAQGDVLARQTMASIEEQLGAGFVRVHRSHLVARAEIVRIETNASGDFTVTLRDGRSLPGSRRYRDRLDTKTASEEAV